MLSECLADNTTYVDVPAADVCPSDQDGGDDDGPPACILDQIMPFIETDDDEGMLSYICGDQFNTSTCNAAEMARVDANVPQMCAELAELGGGSDDDGPPACIVAQLGPFIEAEDESGMMDLICTSLNTDGCDDAELDTIAAFQERNCGNQGQLDPSGLCTLEDAQVNFCPGFDFDQDGN
eukprot:SAG31_NODE_6593_length_1958_cov_3.704680_1_plen_179_part_10